MQKILAELLLKSGLHDVDINELQLQFSSHPDHPSLRAVTDTLDYFHVNNMAAAVPKEALAQLPKHFLALVNEDNETTLMLASKRRNHVHLLNQANGKSRMTFEGFTTKWTGTIIAVEPNDQKNYIGSNLNLSVVLLTVISMLGMILATLENFLPWENALIFLSFLGLLCSYFIVKEDLGLKDKITKKVCSTLDRNNDGCEVVIKSGHGKINEMGLSDLSLIFFLSNTLVGFTIGIDAGWSYLLALCSIPVVFFSLYIQAVTLKQWCLLCLSVSLILIAQFLLLHITLKDWAFSWTYMLKWSFMIALISLSWYWVKAFWKDSIKLQTTLKDYLTLKKNSKVFLHLLHSNEPQQDTAFPESHRIVFGSGSIELLAVTNPFCGFCREPFEGYDHLLNIHESEFRISFIFNVPEDRDNPATKIALRIIELYESNPKHALTSFRDWFRNKDSISWLKKYGEFQQSKKSLKTLKYHREWCNEREIIYTPVTFVDGNTFPRGQYNTKDLQFFIEDLKTPQFDEKQFHLMQN